MPRIISLMVEQLLSQCIGKGESEVRFLQDASILRRVMNCFKCKDAEVIYKGPWDWLEGEDEETVVCCLCCYGNDNNEYKEVDRNVDIRTSIPEWCPKKNKKLKFKDRMETLVDCIKFIVKWSINIAMGLFMLFVALIGLVCVIGFVEFFTASPENMKSFWQGIGLFFGLVGIIGLVYWLYYWASGETL